MRLWVATGNSNKYGELRDTVAMLGFPVELLPLETAAVDESGVSYYQNAFRKAVSGARLRGESIVIADDSGLEIPELGGLPGVHSARFSWKASTGCRALQELLSERGIVTAPARFVCYIVGFLPANPLCISAVATVSGTIHAEARGLGGFGYDPLFIPDDESETFAEMPGKHKAVISHRAKAFVAFMGMLGGVTPRMP